MTCDSKNKSESVTLISATYDQLVKLLNSQKMDENVIANMAGVIITLFVLTILLVVRSLIRV